MPELPSGWLWDTVALYGRVFRRGALLALRNWPVGLVVLVYGALLTIVRLIAAQLGILGGFLLYLATVACVSSWLSLVEQVLRSGRVRLSDLPSGFTAYLNDLLTVGFFFWGLSLIAELILRPTSPLLYIVFVLAMLTFLNAVPELIYLGRHAAAELLVESYRFIGENWIEWFPPMVLLGMAVIGCYTLPGGPYGLVREAVLGVLLYFAMIVRGLLFLELASSSRRGREFQRRAAS
jgi:hypothetical protein